MKWSHFFSRKNKQPFSIFQGWHFKKFKEHEGQGQAKLLQKSVYYYK